ncbi:MAG: hypothetical protein ACREVL_04015, partial [Solimonas sp.]
MKPAHWWTELPGALLPAVGFAVLGLLVEHSGIDLWVADRFADGVAGFPFARLWWTDNLLHDGLQWSVKLAALGLLTFAILRWRTPAFRPLVYLLVSLGL